MILEQIVLPIYDHNNLQELNVGNPHPQYLLISNYTGKVKVSNTDTQSGYLSEKLLGSLGITCVEITVDGQKVVQLSNTDRGSSAITNHLNSYDHNLLHSPLSIQSSPTILLSLNNQVLSASLKTQNSTYVQLSSTENGLQATAIGLEPTVEKGSIQENTSISNILTIDGGESAVIGSGVTIGVQQADATHSGYLSNTDWQKFSNAQGQLILGDLTSHDQKIYVEDGEGSVVGETVTLTLQEAYIQHDNLGGINTTYKHITSEQLAALHPAITKVDTPSLSLTLNGQQLSGTVLPSGITHNSIGGLNSGEYQHLTTTQVSQLLQTKVSINDTTSGYLSTKITSGSGIDVTELNNGENEILSIINTDRGSSAVSSHLLAFNHSDIAHTNRSALDSVSGTNTGDQDLSGKENIGVAEGLLTNHVSLSDPHVQYLKETDFTVGSLLFRGATTITEDNSGIFFQNTPKIRLGIGTNTPSYILTASITSDNIEAFRLDQLGTGSAYLSLHTQSEGGDPVLGLGIDGVGAGPSWHIGLDNSAQNDILTFYQGTFRTGFKRMVFSHYRSIILGSDVGLPALGTSTYAVIPNITETTSESKLSILSGNAGKSAINLGDTDDEDAAYISYDHATTTMKLHTEGAYVEADYGIRAIQPSKNYTGDFRNINANGAGIYVRTFSALSGNSILVLQGDNGSKKIFYARCDGNIGIGMETPVRKLEILDTTNPQLRLTHTANSIFSDFQVDASGNLTITASGENIYLPTGKNLHLGADITGFEGYDFTVNGSNGGIILKRTSTSEPFLLLFNNTANSGGQIRGFDSGGLRLTNYGATVNYLQATAAGITLFGGASGVDYTLTLDGQTLDGILTWMEDEGRLDFDSHFALKVDNKKLYFGAGYNFSTYYDGTIAHLKTNEVAASDLKITTGSDKSLILENGLLALKETTTPTAVTDYGRVYTKSDNKLYFQDGSGNESGVVKETDFTAGSVLFRGASTITEDNSGLYYNYTNKRLGINTTNPLYSVHVETTSASNDAFRLTQLGTGGAYVSLHTRIGGNHPAIGWAIDGGSVPSWHFGMDNNDGDTLALYEGSMGAGSGGKLRMYFLNNNGIIVGGNSNLPSIASSTGLIVNKINDTDTSSVLSIIARNTGLSVLNFGDEDDENIGIMSYNHGTDGFTWRANTTDKMFLDSSGLLGLGISPSYGLHLVNVQNSIVLSSTADNNANKSAKFGTMHYSNTEEAIWGLIMTSTNTANSLSFGGSSSTGNAATELKFYTGATTTTTTGTVRMLVDSAGNVGINTTAPARRLESLDTTNPQERWTHTAGSVYGEVQANSSGHLIFTSTSNKTLINNSYVAPTLANEVATKQYVDDAVILQIADEWEKSYLGPNYEMSITFDETLGGIINTNELVPEDLHIETGADKSLILENGLLALKEVTTPTAVADYGRIYTKSDNKLYFQDGSGVEHEVQFVS